ncbi:VanZ family protein [Microbacterium sp. B2969]|uniref:VanZ family protein n=1 Tax=Microbacterium alkaliflavum TaxID=3248839 RepID=A0ABW7Q347_9MICO
MTVRRRVTIALLVVYSAFVAYLTLTPTGPDDGATTRLLKRLLDQLHAQGVLLWIDFLTIEFLANIAMFVPLGVLTALLISRRNRWMLLVIGTAASGFIELMQLLFLPERYADWRDLVSNTIGFLLGAGLTLAISTRARARTRARAK